MVIQKLNPFQGDESRRILLRQGTERFGVPKAAVLAAVEDIRDLDHLESLVDRIVEAEVSDWPSFLGLG